MKREKLGSWEDRRIGKRWKKQQVLFTICPIRPIFPMSPINEVNHVFKNIAI